MIVTYSGRYVNPFEMKPEDVDIADIAHALSLLCRYNGHSKRFYSVAEHCTKLVQFARSNEALQLVPTLTDSERWAVCRTQAELDCGCSEPTTANVKLQRRLLLHDASEAYLADVPAPYKRRPEFEPYRRLEADVQAMVYMQFHLRVSDPELDAIVHKLDTAIRGNEMHYLLHGKAHTFVDWPQPLPMAGGRRSEWGWTPEDAEANFLHHFTRLFGTAD